MFKKSKIKNKYFMILKINKLHFHKRIRAAFKRNLPVPSHNRLLCWSELDAAVGRPQQCSALPCVSSVYSVWYYMKRLSRVGIY